jgi:ribosome maturation factor RimP
LAGCASQQHGFSIVDIDERHKQEALRSELRRLARQWRVRIRTVARAGRVGAVRLDECAAVDRVIDALGEISNGSWALPGRRRRTPGPPM